MVNKIIKNIIKYTFLYDIYKYIRQEKELRDWEKRGRPIPLSHLVKQEVVKGYAKKFSIHTLIETGVYLGNMIDATKDTFSKIFSIELDKVLYERARKKFSGFTHISIIQGDSSEVLPKILANITQPCLFWLDGHYSGGITAKGKIETPIIQEVSYILGHSITEHVILIDDARLFIGQNGWSGTEGLRDLVFKKCPDWVFEIKDDIIRIHKRCDT